MVVKVLGPLDTGAESLSPRERTVLSALVVRLGTTVRPSELAEAWWGDAPPRTWEQQVRNSVARIRSRLGRESIETIGWEYRLAIDPDAIDAVRFERLVSAARGHALRAEHDRAIDAYTRALRLWRGAALPDVANWEPGVVEALRLDEIRASAEEELLDARLAHGEHRSLIAHAERLLREQPLREDRWAIVALANYRAHRQAEALAVLRAARERLADELGIEPGARLAALEVAMLRRDPELDVPDAAPSTPASCPYPGLRAFEPEEAEIFFGREGDVETVLERFVPGAVVTVAGASGTGKSSLLLAGVLPRLVARGRTVEVIRPGTDGAAALRRASERAGFLVIDQAEELLGATAEQTESFTRSAREFLDGGGAIAITVRSDALDRLRAIPLLGEEIGRGVFLLGGLSDTALRSAIEDPARFAGLTLEPGLVELAVQDAGDRTSTLAHLSHALRETWDRREGTTLTVAGYRDSGGIAGAIAQSAEEVYRALPPDQQDLCRSLMLRMLERGAGGVSTRRRVTTAPLLADTERRHVLDRLIQSRLVMLDGDAVIVAHEAVATAWPRLDGWLEEDAESARTLRAVESAAATWDAGGRDDDDLLRGARLHSALEWQDAANPDLTEMERDLLTASAEHEQGELRELTDRAARERRRNRILRGALGASAVLLTAALVAGGIAVVRGREAAEAAENARIEALIATSLSLRANDRNGAALLAAEAYRRWPDDGRVRSALFGTITAAAGALDTHRVEGAARTTTALIGDTGTALLVRDGEAGTALEIVDVATGEVARTLDVELPTFDRWLASGRDIAISADGRVALVQSPILADPRDTSSCCWNRLDFVDLTTGTSLPGSQLLRMRTSNYPELGEDGAVAFFAHPPTGELYTVDSSTGEVRASSPAVFDDFIGERGPYNSVAFLDADHIVTTTADGISVYDRDTLTKVRSVPVGAGIGNTDLLPDGAGGVFAAGDAGIAFVRPLADTVEWVRSLPPTGTCLHLALTADGTLLCSTVGRLVELDATSGYPTGRVLKHDLDSAVPFAVVDDRTVLIDGGWNALWMRWRLDGTGAGITALAQGRRLAEPPSPNGRLITVEPIEGGPMQIWDLASDSPTGVEADRLLLLSDDVVDYYDEDSGYGLQSIRTKERHPYRIPRPDDVYALGGGGWGELAFMHVDRTIIAFDPATGEQVGETLEIEGAPFDEVWSISGSPDGEQVAVIWWSHSVGRSESGVFRLADGELLARGLPDRHRAILTPSGGMIAVANERVERVDTETLTPTSTLALAASGSWWLMASVDGRTLLNIGYDSRIRLYDLTRDIPLGDVIQSEVPSTWISGALTPDGTTLLTNGPRSILAWDLRPAAQAAAACALAGREFTSEEWTTYFPGEEQVATCAELTAR